MEPLITTLGYINYFLHTSYAPTNMRGVMLCTNVNNSRQPKILWKYYWYV